jgi:membrane protein DedA with SNARE-associated domain
MTDILQFLVRHGYLVIFFWLLAEQAALPIPSVPLMLVCGALARSGQLTLVSIVIYALAGCLIADNIWFQIGRRFSGKALQFICKMSLEPDSCVRRTENIFIKYGLRSLLLSKFIPGLNVVAAPLAGGSGANFSRFLLFDTAGTLIWIIAYVSVGYMFSDQLELAAAYAMRMGSGFVVLAMFVFAAWLGWKSIQRRRFVKSINMLRISAEELHAMVSAGSALTIIDVRSGITQESDLIPGALRIPTEELAVRHEEIPRDRDIVLFCT